MKKRNKVIITFSVILLLIAIFLVVGFYLYSQNEIKKIKEEAIEIKKQELIDEYEAKDQYIGINGCFLGTVNNNGEWNSANEYNLESELFYLGDDIKINVNKMEFTADDIINNNDAARILSDDRDVIDKYRIIMDKYKNLNVSIIFANYPSVSCHTEIRESGIPGYYF